MGKGVLGIGLGIICLAAIAWSQAGPKLTGVEPVTAKVGDSVTVLGENLGKETVEAILLSDDETDYPAEMVEQGVDRIVLKVPVVKAGGYNVSIQIENNIYIQPVRITVQE